MNYKRILQIKYLEKTYGRGKSSFTAIDEMSFDVLDGEFFTIMGTSGSGKTTLLNMLAGVSKATNGEIIFDGKDINSFSRKELENYRGNLVTYIFQDFKLIDNISSLENVLIPFKIHSKKWDMNKIHRLARRMDIFELLNKYPKDLSGGQKQKVAALRAIAIEPKIILADEPTGALDSKSSIDLLKILKDINKVENTTIIMVTHDSYAASFADRIVFIKDGKIINELMMGDNESQKDYYNKINKANKQIIMWDIMNRNFKINLKANKSNNLILKILIIFTVFSYLLLSIQNNEIFKYLYEDGRNYVITNIFNTYILAIALFAVLSYYGLKNEIYNNHDEIKLLINMGLKRCKLYMILLSSIGLETFLGFILGLPLGILLAEIIDLLSILLLDLNIGTHRINFDAKAMGLTLALLVLFVMLSLAIIVLSLGKKYQDKVNSHKIPVLIIKVLLILGFVYYASDKAIMNFKLTLFLIAIDIFIIFFIRKLINASKVYSYEKSLFLFHISEAKIILLFILIALTVALSNLNESVFEIGYYLTDSKLRPHFSVFEDIDVINDIREDYSNIFSDIYPINICGFSDIDDSDFKNEIENLVDLTNGYPVSSPKIMDYSSYKKVFGDNAINLSSKEDSIYLYSKQIDRTSFAIINAYLADNESFINIGALKFKVNAVARSDIIFANDMYWDSNIYVINDDIYDRFVGEKKPIVYNFVVSDDYIEKHGKNTALEKIRNDFFKRNIRFESLVWMIKHSYSNILSRQFVMIYLFIILILISGLFLSINIMAFFNRKSNDFKVLSLLGDTAESLLEIQKSHIVKIYSLIISLSLINYFCYFRYIKSISTEYVYYRSNFYMLAFYILIPVFFMLLMLISEKLVSFKDINYE